MEKFSKYGDMFQEWLVRIVHCLQQNNPTYERMKIKCRLQPANYWIIIEQINSMIKIIGDLKFFQIDTKFDVEWILVKKLFLINIERKNVLIHLFKFTYKIKKQYTLKKLVKQLASYHIFQINGDVF